MDCSPPGSSVRGILQARILEWVAISFSRGSFRSRDWTASLTFLASAGGFFTTSATWEVPDGQSRGLKNQEFLVLTLLCDFEPDPALLWASASPSVKRESWSQTSLRRPSLKILRWQRRGPVAGTRSVQSWFSSRIRDCALQDAAATLLPRHSRFRECGPGEGCHLGSAASTAGSASRSLIRCYPPSAVSMSPRLCHSSGTPGLGANCLFMRPSVLRWSEASTASEQVSSSPLGLEPDDKYRRRSCKSQPQALTFFFFFGQAAQHLVSCSLTRD